MRSSQRNTAMHRYLIVGCGYFGSRAVHTLLAKNPRSEITVVDRREASLDGIRSLPVDRVVSDGRAYLAEYLSENPPPCHIIPAVPFHLAFEFLLASLKNRGAARAEVPPLQGLPHCLKGRSGDLYTSYSDFLCPDDCPEPAGFCTVTGKTRDAPLFERLECLVGSFESRVIRSLPLGPGVGGFRSTALLSLLEEMKTPVTKSRLFLISTACRCHGVVSALARQPGLHV